nr:unnamed protein product [Callosobruchus analis]
MQSGGCPNTVMDDLNLCMKGYGGTGTMRDNRMPCPLSDKKTSRRRNEDILNAALVGRMVVKWDDNSIVTIATNRYGVSPETNARLYSRKEKEHIQIMVNALESLCTLIAQES